MIPIRRLLQRIRWDPEFGRAEFVIGYWDRVKHCIVKVPFGDVRLEERDHFSFTVVETDGSVHHVPLHRIREVYRNGERIWQRPAHDGKASDPPGADFDPTSTPRLLRAASSCEVVHTTSDLPAPVPRARADASKATDSRSCRADPVSNPARKNEIQRPLRPASPARGTHRRSGRLRRASPALLSLILPPAAPDSALAMSQRTGDFELEMDAPWRMEPRGLSKQYGAIPIQARIHDADQPRTADDRRLKQIISVMQGYPVVQVIFACVEGPIDALMSPIDEILGSFGIDVVPHGELPPVLALDRFESLGVDEEINGQFARRQTFTLANIHEVERGSASGSTTPRNGSE